MIVVPNDLLSITDVAVAGAAISFYDRGTKCEGRGSVVNERSEGDGSDYPLTGF